MLVPGTARRLDTFLTEADSSSRTGLGGAHAGLCKPARSEAEGRAQLGTRGPRPATQRSQAFSPGELEVREGSKSLVCSVPSPRGTFPPLLGRCEDWALSVPPQLKVVEQGKQALTCAHNLL